MKSEPNTMMISLRLVVRQAAFVLAMFTAAMLLTGCKAQDETSSEPPGENTAAPNDPERSDDGEDDNDGDEGGETDDSGECENDDDCNSEIASCGPGEAYLPLVNDYQDLGLRVRVDSGRNGRRCRHCEVRDADAVIENNLLASARMRTPAGTSSSVYITVRMPHAGYGMERTGFLVSSPEGLHESGVINRIDVTAVRDGATVDRADPGEENFRLLETGDDLRYLVLLETDEGFDSVRIRLKGDSERDHALDVYAACVDRYGW